jgi:RNA polymerase sigma-70 factor (ECF subfamily)
VGSESEKLDGLRRGEARAFDEIYESLRPRLYAFLLRLCLSDAHVEDLLQETFMRLVQHRRELPAGTDLAAWLFTVARNLAHSHGRWRMTGERVLAVFRLAPSPSPETPLDRLCDSEELRGLERALRGLPVKSREMLLLAGVEGFSMAEVAAILNVRPEAARQRLSRARAALAAAMATNGGPSETER